MQLQSPIVTWRGIRTTLSKIVELAGWPTADEFYEAWGEQQQQEWDQQQAEAEQQPQDPQAMLVEIEGQRVQLEAQESQAKLELEERKMMLEDDRARDKVARDFAIAQEKLRIEGEGAADDRRVTALVEADRTAQDADIRREEAQRAVEAATAAEAPAGQSGQPQ
jgi:dTMP kinase